VPNIVETLAVDNAPHFVVLAYGEFVTFVADASPMRAPDVVAVLDHQGEHAFAVVRFNDYVAYVRTLDIAGTIDERHYLDQMFA
jgi:hypothetical protein